MNGVVKLFDQAAASSSDRSRCGITQI